MCIKVPHGHVRKRSQILMLRSKPLFFWPRRILSLSLRTSLFDSQLLIVYRVFFCLQLETSFSVSGPAKKRRTHFLWSKLFFFFFFFFFRLLLFSRREKRRKDYYRYLRQWIIEIFIITRPYKLCTKRETKVEKALPRKITWLPSLNLCGIRSCLTVKMNREYNIL